MNNQYGGNVKYEEEIKDDLLNKPSNNREALLNGYAQDINEMSSVTKTKRGNNVDKHCIVPECYLMGKVTTGKHWHRHKEIHCKNGVNKEDIKYVDCRNDETCQQYHGVTCTPLGVTCTPLGVTCTPLGVTCTPLGVTGFNSYFIVVKSQHGKHRQVQCKDCSQWKRSSQFDIDEVTCMCCAGKQGKSRTQISLEKKTQIGQGINKSIKRIKPNSNDVPLLLEADDSVSQCAFEQENQIQVQAGSNVTKESLFHLPQHTFDFSGSLINPASDRDLLSSVPVLNNEPKIIYKWQKDPEQLALSKIIQLEKSDDSIHKKTFAILEISQYLVNPLIINFITSQNQSRVADILMEVQEQVDEYSDEQITTVMVASTFQERSWCSVSKNLGRVDSAKREYILAAMEAHLKKFIPTDIAEWICSNWQHLQEQTYHLIYAIKNSNQEDIVGKTKKLLILSRLVWLQKQNIVEYLRITKVFITSDSANLILQGVDHVKTRSMNFDDYVLLLSEIQKNYNKELILEKKEALLELPPQAWLQWLSETKVQARIANTDSVDGYYKKLVQKNGPIAGLGGFIQAGDKQLRRIIHEAKIEPNNLQLAVAKYLVDLNKPMVLCNVPSGQGKSRIAATVNLVLLLKSKTQLIRMVFPNQHLMDRDKAEFEAYWILAGAAERVSYHIGLDFQMNAGDVLVIDEADLFIFANPVHFKNIIGKHRCICLTGTPDNCDLDGVERQILQALECAMVDSVVENPEQAFELPEIKELDYDDQDSQAFIQFIQDKLTAKPIILITSQDRLTQLDQSQQSYILIKNDISVNAAFLRNLDSHRDEKQRYLLFVCIGDIGIRGLDFRSIRAGIAEIIDTPFGNMRSLFQGLKRVGRAGDPCEYYKTKRVQADLLDSNSVIQQKAMLLKSLAQLESLLQKRTAEQALSEKISGSKQKPVMSKLGQTRATKLLSKQEGALNKFFK